MNTLWVWVIIGSVIFIVATGNILEGFIFLAIYFVGMEIMKGIVKKDKK